MSISTYLHKHLKGVATTYPLVVPLEVSLPYITYTLESEENIKSVTGLAYTTHFVSVSVYAKEYDDAQDLAEQIKEVLRCVTEENIIGTTFSSSSSSFDGEPIDTYSNTLEFTIYKR